MVSISNSNEERYEPLITFICCMNVNEKSEMKAMNFRCST